MLVNGAITSTQYTKAVAQRRLHLRPGRVYSRIREPYFFSYVEDQLQKQYGANTVRSGGLRVFTTIDPRLQRFAVDAIKSTLDRTPPELAADVMDQGIVLTGGGALLRGLDERLKHETGMPVHITDNPLHSVAIGSGKCVEEFEALQQVLISEPRH